MAKEDFCFTYYDGDAARDKAHMTRLERGAYDDLISAQRKKGHLSLNDIQRVLSKDFDTCWSSLEWILKKDAEEKFFIEWVDKSLEKMRSHAKRQSENGKLGGRPKKMDEEKPNAFFSETQKKPLENGNGYVNEDENKKEDFGKSENLLQEKFLVPEMLNEWKKVFPNYPDQKANDYPSLLKIAQFISEKEKIDCDIGIMPTFKHLAEHVKQDNFFKNYSLLQVAKHIQNIVQKIQNGKAGAKRNSESLRDQVQAQLNKRYGSG